MKRPSLTDRQRAVLNALNRLIASMDRVPTQAELAKEVGVGRTTITMHLATLEEKGYILRTRRWHDLSVVEDDDAKEEGIND